MLRAVARAVGQHLAVEAQAGQRRAQLVGRRRCELLPVAGQPVDLSDQTDQKDAGHEGCQRSAAEGPGETPGNRAGLGGRGGHSLGGICFYDPILAHRQRCGGLQRVRGPRSHSCRENRALEHGVHGTREQDEPLGQPGRRCRDLAQRNQRRSLLDRNRVPMEGSDRGHAAGRLNQARLGQVRPFAHGRKPCRGRALQLVEDRELGGGGTVGGGQVERWKRQLTHLIDFEVGPDERIDRSLCQRADLVRVAAAGRLRPVEPLVVDVRSPRFALAEGLEAHRDLQRQSLRFLPGPRCGFLLDPRRLLPSGLRACHEPRPAGQHETHGRKDRRQTRARKVALHVSPHA